MGVFIKRRQGVEYLYVLAGNSQYFLGRKDDLDNLNVQNLRKAASTIDKNFDKTLARYLADMQDRVQYMSEKERQKYVTERLDKFSLVLEQASSKMKP